MELWFPSFSTSIARADALGDLRMRKVIVGLLFTVLASTGYAAGTVAAASAEPYPGTVPTTVTVKHKQQVQKGKKVRVRATVTAAGNSSPTGRVKITVKRAAGGYKLVRFKAYSGGTVKIRTGKLRKLGKYNVKVKYKPTAGSVWKKSKAKTSFRVKRPTS